MNSDEKREDFYQEIPSKFGLYFILFVCSALGAMFTFGALTRGIRQADDLVLLTLGLAGLACSLRLYQISYWPSFSLAQDELIIRKWFGASRFSYSEIESLSEYSQWTKPRNLQTGKKMEPFLIHYLAVTLRSGKSRTFTLPTYRSNQRLLESISRRTSRTIESLGVRGEK